MADNLVNPQESGPPSPEEFNARTNGWMQAIDALRTNPAAQQALMFFGARMLQGPRLGQSGSGAVGEAALGGMQMYNTLQQNQQDQASAEQDRQSQREVRAQQVQESKQRTEESRQKAPLEMRRIEAETKWREAAQRVEAARAAGLEAQDPAEMARLDLELAKLKLESEKALTAARNRSNQAGGGGTEETLAEKQYREQQEIEDKAAYLWAAERQKGITEILASDKSKKKTPLAAAQEWDTMNPFNVNIYRAKARTTGKVAAPVDAMMEKTAPKPKTLAEVKKELAEGKQGTALPGNPGKGIPQPPPYDPLAFGQQRQAARIAELTKSLSERFDADLYAELQALKQAQIQSQMPMVFPGR